VVLCHCEECLRWNGHVSASTAVERDHLHLLGDDTLSWIKSPQSDSQARRGFCSNCGSSLFWDAPHRSTISIAAGTLDRPTRLRVSAHWYVGHAGDYYDIPDDHLPHHERGGDTSWDPASRPCSTAAAPPPSFDRDDAARR